MIRDAILSDIPDVLEMVKSLHASTRMALPLDDVATARSLRALVAGQGLLLVSEEGGRLNGFVAATVGVAAISMAPIAMELGWWAAPGSRAGLRLLILYERWAESKGCRFIRMSTPPHNHRAALILERRGFFVSETAWAKAI